jgi:N-acetylmuramoyl-L-alanine amidase
MAKWCALLVVALFAVAGCQPQSQVAVSNLPSPNFSGPTFVDRTPPAPPQAPVAVVPPPKPMLPLKPIEPPTGAVPAAWIPAAPTGHWYWIVIHHSATPTGGAAAFDKMHKAKGWDELGYHFVIGNGTDTADGKIEVGPRWPKQKWGAHDKTPGNQYNEHGIGICLVGNFDVTHPTAAQTKSLERLVSYLMKTYHIAPDHVLGHGETKATECPGRYMNVAAIRRACAHMIAGAHPQAETSEPQPGQELLADTRGQ